jgi:CxxC motif-containing protein
LEKISGGFKMKIIDYVSQVKFGDPQKYEDIIIIPIFAEIDKVLFFITLDEALKTNEFHIKEVDQSGTVPNLKVINKLDQKVFILDGEELKGGKQNRVVNTSLLIKNKSEFVIPVSCTEQGRWHYQSHHFGDPDVVMPADIRRIKNESVFYSLAYGSRYDSDQGAIWHEISKLQDEFGVKSETSAMRDVFEKRKNLFESMKEKFPCIEGQNGIVVFQNGKFDGLDIISLKSAYKNLHNKLIKSYIFRSNISKKGNNGDYGNEYEKFLKEIEAVEPLKFKSPALGWDLRIASKNFVGSILTYANKPIHINFFRKKEYNNKKYINRWGDVEFEI